MCNLTGTLSSVKVTFSGLNICAELDNTTITMCYFAEYGSLK